MRSGRWVTSIPSIEYKRAKFIGRVFQDPMMGTAATVQIEENLTVKQLLDLFSKASGSDEAENKLLLS